MIDKEILYRAICIIELLRKRKNFSVEEFLLDGEPVKLHFNYDSDRKIYIINKIGERKSKRIASLTIEATFSSLVADMIIRRTFQIIRPRMKLPIDIILMLKIARFIKRKELLNKGYDMIKTAERSEG